MTIEQFVDKIEGYYGEYNDVMRSVVVAFLHSRYPGMEGLDRLFAEVVNTFTAQYKAQPDVAVMRPLVLRIIEEKEHEWLASATRMQLPDPSECVDPEDGERFMRVMIECLSNKQNPEDNAEINDILAKYGVAFVKPRPYQESND